jgi:hypothetical protein
MLGADLAALYGVSTRVLNQAVKRNAKRFPEDFMFRLTAAEKAEVITNCDHLRSLKFSPALPYAFTEHGAIMAAMVLNSPCAVEMSVQVVRAFVRLREMLATNKALADKLAELECKGASHDEHIQSLFEAIRQLMAPAQHKPRRTIGFRVEEARPAYRRGRLRLRHRRMHPQLPSPLEGEGQGEGGAGLTGRGFS